MLVTCTREFGSRCTSASTYVKQENKAHQNSSELAFLKPGVSFSSPQMKSPPAGAALPLLSRVPKQSSLAGVARVCHVLGRGFSGGSLSLLGEGTLPRGCTPTRWLTSPVVLRTSIGANCGQNSVKQSELSVDKKWSCFLFSVFRKQHQSSLKIYAVFVFNIYLREGGMWIFHRGQKSQHPPHPHPRSGLELQAVGRHLPWVLGTELTVFFSVP